MAKRFGSSVQCEDCGRPVSIWDSFSCLACYKAYLCGCCAYEHEKQHKAEKKARKKSAE